MLGSSAEYASCPEKILKVWCVLVYILIRLCLENSLKINIFLYKTYFYVLVYILKELRIESSYFHIEIMISATEMLGDSGACSPRKF